MSEPLPSLEVLAPCAERSSLPQPQAQLGLYGERPAFVGSQEFFATSFEPWCYLCPVTGAERDQLPPDQRWTMR